MRLVNIAGAIVTIDAMGTQRAIAAQIVEQGADFCLALKGNQGTLHEAVIQHIEHLVENDFAGVDVRQHTTKETGHGRDETCCHTHLPAPPRSARQGTMEGAEVNWRGDHGGKNSQPLRGSSSFCGAQGDHRSATD